MIEQETCRIVTGSVGRAACIEVEFQVRSQSYRIFFRSTDPVLSDNAEAWVTCGILPCMKAGGGKLISEGEISRKFLAGLSTVQDIYHSWDPSFQRAEVEGVTPVRRAGSGEGRVATFFSAGVDSFYTLLKHREEITDLIFVHGLDIRLDDTTLRERSSSKIRQVASKFGKNLIEIETNIRDLFAPYADWGLYANGAALAAIGHLLFPSLGRIYIPASHTYAQLFAWGSHPLLDPLWSSEALEFVHDGCEATRVEKVALVSQCDIALRSLRVCWENPNSSYNCGRCEKCLRTMINLQVNNALSRCTTFETALDLRNVLKIDATSENVRSFVTENLEALEKSQGNDELRKALQRVLNRPQRPRNLGRRAKKFAEGIARLRPRWL